MFVDRIKVFAQAGKGGRGSVSFRREKFVPKGGPDGGDGGRGGDVILRADRHADNLSNLFYEPIIKAKNGGHGMGKKMAGRSGADKVVKVPVGTIVWQAEEGKRPTPKAFASRQLNVQHSMKEQEKSKIENRKSKMNRSSILFARGRSLFFVAAVEARATCISKARAIARRANTPKARKASRDTFCSSCARSPMRRSLVILTPANRLCFARFPPRAQRSRRIHSRRCIRSSVWSIFPNIAAQRSPIFP